jgi:hypothetical protein
MGPIETAQELISAMASDNGGEKPAQAAMNHNFQR